MPYIILHWAIAPFSATATDGQKPSSELEEEDVWYVASEDLQPHKTTTASNTAPPATLKTLLFPQDTPSPSLPAKNPKPDVAGRQTLPSTSQQQAPKSSANVQSPVQSQKPGDSAFVPVQQAKTSPVDRQIVTQKIYDEKQIRSITEQLPANQMVWCLHKGSGCTWKGVVAQLIQHLSIYQYNQKSE